MSKVRNCFLKGFTLVELLVVVAIIALLLSILLPSLARAREQAKKSRCLANLKDVGSASMVYATADTTDILVPGPQRKRYPVGSLDYFWGNQHFGGKGGSRDYVGHSSKDGWNARSGFGPGDRPLNGVIFKNPTWESWMQAYYAGRPYAAVTDQRLKDHNRLDMEQFHCPSDVGLVSNTGAFNTTWGGPLADCQIQPETPFYDVMGNSYVTHWLTPLLYDPSHGNQRFGLGAYRRSVSSVPNAARCIIYREGNASNVEDFNCYYPANRSKSQNLKIEGWHGETMEFTAAFADGHAAGISHLVRTDITGMSTDGMTITRGTFAIRGQRAEITQLPDTYYNPPFNAALFMSRGDGWQMDYFPCPPNIVIDDYSGTKPSSPWG